MHKPKESPAAPVFAGRHVKRPPFRRAIEGKGGKGSQFLVDAALYFTVEMEVARYVKKVRKWESPVWASGF
jgi:hypothetical protein